MSSVPSEICGTFKLERSENFEELLAAKGISWVFRKMMALSSITKIISNVGDGKYNMKNVTPMKTVDYGDWKLDEQFEAIGLDGKVHKITFGVENNALTEEHLRSIDDPNEIAEKYRYARENDYLVLTMNYKDIICKRFFKKVNA